MGRLGNCLLGGPRQPLLIEGLLLGGRLYGGITIAMAGYDKLPTPPWMAEQVTQVGFPAPELFATIACLTEFVAGLLLALGVLTRVMGFLLAFTMGVAAFGFHRVDPILGMHITQGFFWLFVAYLALGGGRLSIDGLICRRAMTRVGVVLALVASLGMLGWGAFLEFGTTPTPPEPAGEMVIESVSIPGSFNDWDITVAVLEATDDGRWVGIVELPAGAVQFKFAANGSWDVNLGDDDPGTAGFPISGTGEPGGENITLFVPVAGPVRFELDADSYDYSVTSAE